MFFEFVQAEKWKETIYERNIECEAIWKVSFEIEKLKKRLLRGIESLFDLIFNWNERPDCKGINLNSLTLPPLELASTFFFLSSLVQSRIFWIWIVKLKWKIAMFKAWNSIVGKCSQFSLQAIIQLAVPVVKGTVEWCRHNLNDLSRFFVLAIFSQQKVFNFSIYSSRKLHKIKVIFSLQFHSRV